MAADVDETAAVLSGGELQYAGFWPRLCSLFLDGILGIPFIVLIGLSPSRFFLACTFAALFLVEVIFEVYVVQRWGGTPGKLIMGLRIRKVDGSPVGYREAILRAAPNLFFEFIASVGLVVGLSHMSDTEFFRKGSLAIVNSFRPAWSNWADVAQRIWNWGELIVLLTNQKRRALHDFIAGTVVVIVRKEKNVGGEPRLVATPSA